MFKKLNKNTLHLGAAMTAGMLLASSPAHANGGGNDWSAIAANIVASITNLPGLLTALAYMIGILFGVLGVLKIKDHVENPSQTPLKEGAIRLAVGGALFALPIITEAMTNTISQGGGTAATAAPLNAVSFGLAGGT